MTNLIEKYRTWRKRQLDRRLAKWAETRQKGKSHYVAGFALTWCLVMSVFVTAMNYLWGDPEDVAKFTIRLVVSFLGGLLLGLFLWNDMEKQYRKRVTSSDDDRTE